MGLPIGQRPTKDDEKHLLSSDPSPWKRRPPLCHPERSRGVCSSADLSWKCLAFTQDETVLDTFNAPKKASAGWPIQAWFWLEWGQSNLDMLGWYVGDVPV